MTKRCKINNKGLSLVELLVVIAIMAVVAGATTINVSIVNSKDIEQAAKIIEQELALLKMTTKVKEGIHYAVIDNRPDSRTITLSREEADGTIVELSQEELPQRVALSLDGDPPFEFLKITYNKSDGTISHVTPYGAGGIGTENPANPITIIQCNDASGKSADVTIIKATGKQFIAY